MHLKLRKKLKIITLENCRIFIALTTISRQALSIALIQLPVILGIGNPMYDCYFLFFPISAI
jgi:hypothetical protein